MYNHLRIVLLCLRWLLMLLLGVICLRSPACHAFTSNHQHDYHNCVARQPTNLDASSPSKSSCDNVAGRYAAASDPYAGAAGMTNNEGRRHALKKLVALTAAGVKTTLLVAPTRRAMADFAPGGTLVDYTVGPTVGNPRASASRKVDNTNVLFAQDYYFKFGTAAPWIEPDSTDFPKTMPFTRSQQRYDALKKYGDRIQSGLDTIAGVKKVSPRSQIVDPASLDVYQLRPMGLLANNLLASENTGSTNELYLARWYINEIYLLLDDLKNAASDEEAKSLYKDLVDATNSYLTLMNRVIIPKVGEKFAYLQS